MATIRSLITASMKRLNAVRANQPPTAYQIENGRATLDTLIDSLSNELLNIHTISPYRFPLVPGQKSYKLGPALDDNGDPTGADWVIERPMRIETAVVMVYPNIVSVTTPGDSQSAVALYHFNEDSGSSQTLDEVTSAEMSLQPSYELTTSQTQAEFSSHASLAVGGGGEQGFTPPTQTSQNWTFEFSTYWDQSDSHDSGGVLYDFNRNLVYPISFRFTPNDGPSYTMEFRNDNTDFPLIVQVGVSGATAWQQWALVLNGDANTISVYQNGVQQFTGVMSDFYPDYAAFTLDTFNVRRGGYNYNYGDPIYTDELRISNAALYDADYAPRTAEFPWPALPSTTVVTIGENSQTIFYNLMLANYSQYADLTVRTISSTWPTEVYDNGAYPCRDLLFWPVPQNAYGVELWLWQPLATYASIDDQLNLPPGYERYFILKLAVELAPELGKEVTDTLRNSLAEAESAIKTLNQQVTKTGMSNAFKQLSGQGDSWMISSDAPFNRPQQY